MCVKSIEVITYVCSLISLLSFCLSDLSSGESEVLWPPTISMYGIMCDVSLRNVSCTYEGALVFGTYMFSIEISS